MNATCTEPAALSPDEMTTIAGGLRAEWMDGVPPETDLKALWMDGE